MKCGEISVTQIWAVGVEILTKGHAVNACIQAPFIMTLLDMGSCGFAGPAMNRLVQANIDLTFLWCVCVNLCVCLCMCVSFRLCACVRVCVLVLGWGCAAIVYQIRALFSYHFKQFIFYPANGSFRGLKR